MSNTVSNTIRITGMATGLDVDSLVKQMIKAETMKVDKAKQNRQIIQWKQDIYRGMIGDLNTFKSTFFDVLKPDSYMLSKNNYSTFNVKPSDSTIATASAQAGAVPGDYTLSIKNLATKATAAGGAINIEQANSGLTFGSKIDSTVNDKYTITVGGSNYDITVKSGYYSKLGDLASEINSELGGVTVDSTHKLSDKVAATVSQDGYSIQLVAEKEISVSNNILNVNIDGTSYNNIKLDNGNYTLDGLAAQINSKLSGVNDSSGTALSSKIQAQVSSDKTKIEFVPKSGSGVTTITTNHDSDYTAPSIITSNSSTGTQGSVTVTQDTNNVVSTLDYGRKIITGYNDTLNVKVNGANHVITLAPNTYSSGISDKDILTTTLGGTTISIIDQINNKLTTDGVNTTIKAQLSIDGNNRMQFVASNNSTINISGNATTFLGFSSSNFDFNQTVYDKVTNINAGKVDFTINTGNGDIEFKYDFTSDTDKNKTINDIINDISAKAGVKLSYSELTRQFKIESSNTGSSQSLSVRVKTTGVAADDTNSSNFLKSLLGTDSVSAQGSDAKVSITNPNGGTAEVIKSSNTFTIDGVSYNLFKAGTETSPLSATITVTGNTQNAYDKIKAFIDKYNEIVDKINSKIDEKREYRYLPLTDDQKKDMSETDITNWENKAKQGLVRGDYNLDQMLSSMRMAFYDGVYGAGISLSEIGLSTSSDTTQRGKIIVDQDKLKTALQEHGDQVADLFMKTSSTAYDPDHKNYTTRYNEEGIFQRINDILMDNVRTTRNTNGQKGVLIEKAGIVGDYTEYNNILTNQLKDQDKLIDDLNQKLSDKQESYYTQFSKLETAMQQLNSQSSWLAQQLGGGGK